jgi:hypothetical protein
MDYIDHKTIVELAIINNDAEKVAIINNDAEKVAEKEAEKIRKEETQKNAINEYKRSMYEYHKENPKSLLKEIEEKKKEIEKEIKRGAPPAPPPPKSGSHIKPERIEINKEAKTRRMQQMILNKEVNTPKFEKVQLTINEWQNIDKNTTKKNVDNDTANLELLKKHVESNIEKINNGQEPSSYTKDLLGQLEFFDLKQEIHTKTNYFREKDEIYKHENIDLTNIIKSELDVLKEQIKRVKEIKEKLGIKTHIKNQDIENHNRQDEIEKRLQEKTEETRKELKTVKELEEMEMKIKKEGKNLTENDKERIRVAKEKINKNMAFSIIKNEQNQNRKKLYRSSH